MSTNLSDYEKADVLLYLRFKQKKQRDLPLHSDTQLQR